MIEIQRKKMYIIIFILNLELIQIKSKNICKDSE